MKTGRSSESYDECAIICSKRRERMMWVRKTEEEIAEERTRIRFAFGWPLLWGCLAFVANLINSADAAERWPTTVFGSICLGVSVAIAVYFYRIYFGKQKGAVFGGSSYFWVDFDAWICSKCHSVKHPRGSVHCKCGGTFEPIETWKWVEE